jgi:septum formation protein
MLNTVPIILASQSPRRKHLLELAEIPFTILVEETNESYPPDLTMQEVVIYIAKNKALAVKKKYSINSTILAADTIVVLNNQVIGKPKDRAHAIEILSSLSGQKHSVITGVVILNGEYQNCFSETTEVEFYTLTPAQINFYVDKYKPYDKAGAYAIQEWIGVVGIKSIEGDFYNVMGLPISKVMQALAKII